MQRGLWMSSELFKKHGMKDPDYLGDGVYAGHDDFSAILCTCNGERIDNIIYLEPGVINCFQNYLKRIKDKLD